MRPSGDPGSMRDAARGLLDEASRIRASVQAIPPVPESVLLGPAGSRLRPYLDNRRDDGLRAAGFVESAAQTLYEEAARLEAAITQWENQQRATRRGSSSGH